MIIFLIVGLIKKTLYKMSQYFPKPYKSFERNVKVGLDSFGYATKAELKNATRADTSKLAAKADLASLKAEVDKIDVDKLKTVPIDLSKLSNAVKNEVVKKTVYDKLVAKVNNIDNSGFVLKTKYDTDKLDLEKKIPDISGLGKKTDYIQKVSEIETKIPSISGLAKTSALNAVENKIPDISSLVKKTDYNTKISEIEKKVTDHNHDKYITTPEFNKFTVEIFAARFAQGNLVTKADFDTKLIGLNKKLTQVKQNIYLLKMN